jgi:hypothetical protein
MRACELLWDIETADRMEQLITDAGGSCRERCPLLPRDLTSVWEQYENLWHRELAGSTH